MDDHTNVKDLQLHRLLKEVGLEGHYQNLEAEGITYNELISDETPDVGLDILAEASETLLGLSPEERARFLKKVRDRRGTDRGLAWRADDVEGLVISLNKKREQLALLRTYADPDLFLLLETVGLQDHYEKLLEQDFTFDFLKEAGELELARLRDDTAEELMPDSLPTKRRLLVAVVRALQGRTLSAKLGGGKKSRRKITKKSRTTSGKKSRKLRKRTTIKGGKRKRRRTRRRK